MRSHSAIVGLVAAMVALIPLACEAQVYKCQAGGSTTYQAEPCANAPHAPPHIAAPAASSVSGTSVAAPDLHGSLASLRLGLQEAAAEEREMLAQYRHYTDVVRNKMSSRSSAEAARAYQAVSEEWAPRIRAVQLREEQVRQEILRRCPAGAKLDSQGSACDQ